MILYKYSKGNAVEGAQSRDKFLKKDKKKFEKPLDKLPNLCYNKNVPKRYKSKFKGEKTMNTTKKMTSKVALDYVLNNCEVPTEIKEKLTAMREALDRKSANGEKKMTATQIENLTHKAVLEANLSVEPATISDYIKSISEFAGMTPQKLSPIMNTLVEEGKAVKSTIKGRSYFAKA